MISAQQAQVGILARTPGNPPQLVAADQRALRLAAALALFPPGDCSLDAGAAIAIHVLGDPRRYFWTDAWSDPGVRAADDTN